jgi:phosphoenolpyruvate synthase/pyruvate phosphate dikinase
VSLAVVVQAMIPAEAAGVLFTVNPVTGARDEALINATWGLGEALVSGRVTPDTLTVDKATGRIKHVEIGEKAVMTAAAAPVRRR